MLTRDNINDTNITLNFNNLKYDCKACHDREDEHAFIKARNRRYEFDENGNILPLFRNNVAEGGKPNAPDKLYSTKNSIERG